MEPIQPPPPDTHPDPPDALTEEQLESVAAGTGHWAGSWTWTNGAWVWDWKWVS